MVVFAGMSPGPRQTSRIRDAVVLAAGLGTRLRAGEDPLPKPLREVGGRTLLTRTLLTLAAGGVTDAWIVIGYRGDEVRAATEADPHLRASGPRLHFLANPEYEKSNGVSVLTARPVVTGPFVLTMSDHVYEPSLVELVAGADMRDADLHLCVDRRLGEIYDMDDATKVRTEWPRIVEIGKTLADFDCVDCGVFAVGPALYDALARAYQERQDCSLSDGVRRLAEAGRARVVDIGAAFWQDVDTPGALSRAELELARRATARQARA